MWVDVPIDSGDDEIRERVTVADILPVAFREPVESLVKRGIPTCPQIPVPVSSDDPMSTELVIREQVSVPIGCVCRYKHGSLRCWKRARPYHVHGDKINADENADEK